MRGAEGAYVRGGGGRAGGEIDSIRRAEEVSDARSFPAGEVSDARRYPAGEVYQTRGGIPRGRYQTRGRIRRAERYEPRGAEGAGPHVGAGAPSREVSDARRYQTRGAEGAYAKGGGGGGGRAGG